MSNTNWIEYLDFIDGHQIALHHTSMIWLHAMHRNAPIAVFECHSTYVILFCSRHQQTGTLLKKKAQLRLQLQLFFSDKINVCIKKSIKIKI